MEIFSGLFSSAWSIIVIAVFFGGSIFVHELGHFLAARRRGLKVERFSIGFGPAIFKWTGKDGVEYRLSWIPLGGYVALPQLGDLRQVEGTSQVSDQERATIPYNAKVEVLVAGAVFNLIFALLLACVIWGTGYPVMRSEQTRVIGAILDTIEGPDGKPVPSPAKQAGLRAGDQIEKVDNREVESWADMRLAIAVGTGRTADDRPEAIITVWRDGARLPITVHPIRSGDEKFRMIGIEPADELLVERVLPGSGAEAAGLRAGDEVVAVDGAEVHSREEISRRVDATKDAPLELTVRRPGGEIAILAISPKVTRDDQGKERRLLGIGWTSPIIYVHTPPFVEIYRQTKKAYWTLAGLLNPKSDIGPKDLNGPVGIGRGFHQVAQVDWRLVLWFTVLVNVNLAIMNLMPIPVLDGGHILFATIGKLRGRPLPTEFMHGVQTVFMGLLLTMIVYVTFFDVRRIARDWKADTSAGEMTAEPAPAPVGPSEPAPAVVPVK